MRLWGIAVAVVVAIVLLASPSQGLSRGVGHKALQNTAAVELVTGMVPGGQAAQGGDGLADEEAILADAKLGSLNSGTSHVHVNLGAAKKEAAKPGHGYANDEAMEAFDHKSTSGGGTKDNSNSSSSSSSSSGTVSSGTSGSVSVESIVIHGNTRRVTKVLAGAAGALQNKIVSKLAANLNGGSRDKCKGGKVKILTLNLWEDLKHTNGKGVDAVVALMKKLHVDVAGFQEVTEATVKSIAEKLGKDWSYAGNPTFVVTRLKILKTYTWQKTDDKKNDKKPTFGSVLLQRCEGMKFRFANAHFWADPASIRQLSQGMDPQKVLRKRRKMNRVGGGIRAAFKAQLFHKKCNRKLPTLFVGDHNEPSVLDHTEEVAKSKQYKKARHLKVTVLPWPISKKILQKGFKDLYRTLHPDVVKRRGWSYPAKVYPGSISDRIDYIYAKDGKIGDSRYSFKLDEAKLVTKKDMPKGHKWVSDHWGYQATVKLQKD